MNGAAGIEMITRMPDSITDGQQYDDQPKDYVVDESLPTPSTAPLAGRIDIAIAQMSKTNYIDFHRLLQLLQDCRRMVEKIELPPPQAD